jgi:hypothetical protein
MRIRSGIRDSKSIATEANARVLESRHHTMMSVETPFQTIHFEA